MNELESLLSAIGKKADFLYKASELPSLPNVSSGLMHIDELLGGGWPLGRQITLYGKPGSAKSTLALYSVKDAQKQGLNCLWIDAENSFDPSWASVIGVDTDNLLVVRTRALESIIDVLQKMYDNKHRLDVIVVDSISAVYSLKVLEEGSHAIGHQAKATKEFMYRASYWFPDALKILISQLTVQMSGTNVTQAPTGGNALKHENSFELFLFFNRGDQKSGEVRIGDRIVHKEIASIDINWVFTKSRKDVLGQRGGFRFVTGLGIDRVHELADAALLSGAVVKSGKWFKYDEVSYNGEEKFIQALSDDLDLMEKIKNEVSERGILGPTIGSGEDSSQETD